MRIYWDKEYKVRIPGPVHVEKVSTHTFTFSRSSCSAAGASVLWSGRAQVYFK